MKKVLSLALALFLTLGLLGGCGTVDDSKPAVSKNEESTSAQSTEKLKTAAICLPQGADEFFVYISNQLKTALEAEGCTVQVADANMDSQAQIKQIQNFTMSGVDFMYVFPAGDANTFTDVVSEATNAGIKTLVSHNNTGEGSATCMVQCDEFIMGTMMAPMVSAWIDKQLPDAGPGEVKALALEQSMIPDMVKRSAGMKIIGEKFLRKIDLSTGKYVKTEGEEVKYMDENGKEAVVEEPTGGLILDDKGFAMLNPYYDARVKVLEISNRTNQNNMDVQNSLDVFVTANNGADADVNVIMCYGGDGAAGGSEKMLSLLEQGTITTDINNIAVFGADITESNIERIKQSANNENLVRGVMTNGNIVQTIADMAGKMVRQEEVPAESWEVLGYMMLNDDKTDVQQVLYDDALPPTASFFD